MSDRHYERPTAEQVSAMIRLRLTVAAETFEYTPDGLRIIRSRTYPSAIVGGQNDRPRVERERWPTRLAAEVMHREESERSPDPAAGGTAP